jgi:general secretion pathway protein A
MPPEQPNQKIRSMSPQPQTAAMNESFTPNDPSAPPPASAADPFDDLIRSSPMSETAAASVVPFVPEGNFLQIYGLRENPFADSVHPSFFFRTESHASSFCSMMLAADFNTSLGLVTGPSGTGKTLISQLLLQHFDEAKFRVVLVLVTPGMSKTGLLREILAELELALPVGNTRVQDLVKLLSNHIIELHQQGRRLVIVIDECHLLSADCLHIIRTISNLEIPEQKLTTCLMIGESRLAHRLEHPSYESLRNRIYFRDVLKPLTLEETGQYVKFRLMTAGRLAELFTTEAFAELYKYSGGIPRTMNKLAMLTLMEGANRRAEIIDKCTVSDAAARL